VLHFNEGKEMNNALNSLKALYIPFHSCLKKNRIRFTL